jgi:hypothetical protein
LLVHCFMFVHCFLCVSAPSYACKCECARAYIPSLCPDGF